MATAYLAPVLLLFLWCSGVRSVSEGEDVEILKSIQDDLASYEAALQQKDQELAEFHAMSQIREDEFSSDIARLEQENESLQRQIDGLEKGMHNQAEKIRICKERLNDAQRETQARNNRIVELEDKIISLQRHEEL